MRTSFIQVKSNFCGTAFNDVKLERAHLHYRGDMS
jgi:hypothetical protein